MFARGGFISVILVVGLLYYTGAGAILWGHIRKLDQNCYATLTGSSIDFAAPTVCGGIAEILAFSESLGQGLSQQFSSWKQQLFGNSLDSLNSYVSNLEHNVASLSSARDQLSQMIQNGPQMLRGGSLNQQFQQAVDSFSIGQMYLKSPGQSAQALPWLQAGAAQSQGFGLISQLTLGNLYAQGGAGVPANPQVAQAYLQQAQNSIHLLSGSRAPQAQQLLQTLPVSPQAMSVQIQQMIAQLKPKQ